MNYIFYRLHSSFSLLKLFVLGIITAYSIPLHAQEIVNDSIAQKESSTKELLQQDLSYISLGFIGSGLIIKQQKKDYRELRHNFIPQYRKTWDDYTQYVPLLSTWALKASGVEGRSTWGGLVVSNALSFGIMATITNGLKYTIREQRPDETSRNSFPSGHTAFAFAAAFCSDVRSLLATITSVAFFAASSTSFLATDLSISLRCFTASANLDFNLLILA